MSDVLFKSNLESMKGVLDVLFVDLVLAASYDRLVPQKNGHWPKWLKAFDALPNLNDRTVFFDRDAVTLESGIAHSVIWKERLKDSLLQFSPWRKGPFDIFGVYVDSEWRSCLKWDRVRPHISSLKGRRVLDVGCGNGYYGWRMMQDDPAWILGIDPSLLFYVQHAILNKYIQNERFWLAPLTLESLPVYPDGFDTIFSMGVLYHRKNALKHLMQIWNQLADEGELVLETLVLEGDGYEVLVPEGRYAKMNNVFFIGTVKATTDLLFKAGFKDVRMVDIAPTTVQEQRSTEWMNFESLSDFLDPVDPTRTIEGYPAPVRAVFVVKKNRHPLF